MMKHIIKLIEIADERKAEDRENALSALGDAARLIEMLESDGRLSGWQLADLKRQVETRVESITTNFADRPD